MNDLENIPWGIFLMWGCWLAEGNYKATTILAVVFTAARILHSICYIYALMPWRTICWVTNVLANFALGANMLYGAYNR